jgi:prepilin-type N-terminal cleavage/methylation domain-containing protein
MSRQANTHRRGLTLLELMLALTISAIMVGSLSVLASATRQAAEFNQGQSDSIQHARVTLQRITRAVGDAYATETYPGVVVVDATVGTYRYPDTVVIWRPANGTPTNPAGPPLIKELVIFGPDVNDPSQFVEVTCPTDTRTIQLNDASLNTSTGRTLISSLKTATSSVKTVITTRVRTAATSTGSNSTRAAIRFECELHPTAAEMASFRGGSTAWSNLSWPQSIYSSTFGLRQVWLRSELQLYDRDKNSDGTLPATVAVMPFFGSATNYYNLTK